MEADTRFFKESRSVQRKFKGTVQRDFTWITSYCKTIDTSFFKYVPLGRF